MNLFNTNAISKGYASDRPYIHPVAIERIRSHLKLSGKLDCALDVGCGAGFSSLALLDIVDSVTGVDSSASMIASAIKKDGISYFNYPAEDLPFTRKFDLITLSGSINWIDRSKFFPKAGEMIKNESYVVVYDNNILGIMEEDDRFEDWYENAFSKKYPRPLRDESPISEEEALEYGFDFELEEHYTNEVGFKLDNFVNYLLTQSNISSILNRQPERSLSIQRWLSSSLSPFFNDQERTMRFGGYIWYLKKRNSLDNHR